MKTNIISFAMVLLVASCAGNSKSSTTTKDKPLNGAYKAEKRHINVFYPAYGCGKRVIEVIRFQEHDYLFVSNPGVPTANFLHSESCAKCEKEKVFLKK